MRAEWAKYFRSKGHKEIPSASLIPAGDPTLLFTTAGMVQFKDYFAGSSKPPHQRVFSIQKCLRTTDLDNVGRSSRHCTFFEMLGNFSFGDYFKSEAILYGWEFSLSVLGFDPEQIHVTIYEEDDEAEQIWNSEIGLPLKRIHRLGKEHNWWGPAGDCGPCGPCSELYLDRGAAICENCNCKDKSNCLPGGEGNRFIEYWNLVFNQFYQERDGRLQPLARSGIDTGAGLERILALLNGCDTIYETAELQKIITATEQLASQVRRKNIVYNSQNGAAFRVVADHIRAAAFSIADGIFPENTGRGYVIRRIIRRALLYARELNIHTPILSHLVSEVVKIYSPVYPELSQRMTDIQKCLLTEEERFLQTLETGLVKWQEFSELNHKKGETVFSGKDAFILYDTYGFPLEITMEMAQRAGLKVNKSEFEAEMQKQRDRSASRKRRDDFNLADLQLAPTQFTGYDNYSCKGKIVAIVAIIEQKQTEAQTQAAKQERRPQEGESRDMLSAPGSPAIIILDKTPFYAEGGGQLGDSGTLSTADGAIFFVKDTRKQGQFHLHIGQLKKGALAKGDIVTASIDQQRRKDTTRHHSATHLLNHVLRKKLGKHVVQTGSLVAPDHLRFDFSHTERIPHKLLTEIMEEVNQAIEQKGAVLTQIIPLEEARRRGAVATFGEKYGSEVRVVSMGKEGKLSMELCGGCHVKNTTDVGFFYINRQTSPGAGNQRIEALAGKHVLQNFQNRLNELRAQIEACNKAIGQVNAQNQAAEKNQAARKNQAAQKNQTARKNQTAEKSQTVQKEGMQNKSAHILLAPISLEDLPGSAAEALKSPHEVSCLQELIEKKSEALQKAQKFLGKKKKSLKNSALEFLLESTVRKLEEAKRYGPLRVIPLLLEEEGPENLRLLSDRLKEKGRGIVILSGSKNRSGPLLLFSADKEAVNQGINVAELVKGAAKLIKGGGGGRPDLAQAGGKDTSGLPQALQFAEEAIEKKMQKIS